jgi:hypothetical protein
MSKKGMGLQAHPFFIEKLYTLRLLAGPPAKEAKARQSCAEKDNGRRLGDRIVDLLVDDVVGAGHLPADNEVLASQVEPPEVAEKII